MLMRWTIDDLIHIAQDCLQGYEKERQALLDALKHAKNSNVNWQILVQIATILITEPLSQAIPDILKLLGVTTSPGGEAS